MGVRHDRLGDPVSQVPQWRPSMAGLPRFALPSQPQHVIQCGNDRQAVFFAEDDYQFYRERLRRPA